MNKLTGFLASGFLPSSDFAATQDILRKDKRADFTTRALWNALPYSQYAYGIHHAAVLAKRLQVPEISVLEFGVAGGNGLVAMEAHAGEVASQTGVAIQVYGFDTGEGMTPPQDHRDMPYRFAMGNYRMDVPKLMERLKSARLVLGDVAGTASTFLQEYNPAPIGFVSFDMDYYSSTIAALAIFSENQDDRYFLPRIQCYFDDVIGSEYSSYNDFVGELAAIRDFNHGNESVKLAESRVFRKYAINFDWYHQIYLMHRFRHSLYGSYISKAGPGSLALR